MILQHLQSNQEIPKVIPCLQELLLRLQRKRRGISTLSARKIWFDSSIKRLNADGNGTYLGEFSKDDKILTFYSNGTYRITGYDLSFAL